MQHLPSNRHGRHRVVDVAKWRSPMAARCSDSLPAHIITASSTAINSAPATTVPTGQSRPLSTKDEIRASLAGTHAVTILACFANTERAPAYLNACLFLGTIHFPLYSYQCIAGSSGRKRTPSHMLVSRDSIFIKMGADLCKAITARRRRHLLPARLQYRTNSGTSPPDRGTTLAVKVLSSHVCDLDDFVSGLVARSEQIKHQPNSTDYFTASRPSCPPPMQGRISRFDCGEGVDARF
ncbi:uncharacterized protein CC84DRAFT_1181297 [Paraphaeosphaeria sporulosa]|uniref:Uncharacterized protein n=1 Tax=Paraphaeosphaeria sporulosa TaxID=1460663 RepID=A0A177BWI1_9PLEO|nr:uncharacterized protein CC84DRAFT_1181297 [Paraphaeosphaeria sporulosa]OAF99843.1 hypothetical protein CC84DRAFT_1181297 [Paraphaeosphaeria sporulosa]